MAKGFTKEEIASLRGDLQQPFTPISSRIDAYRDNLEQNNLGLAALLAIPLQVGGDLSKLAEAGIQAGISGPALAAQSRAAYDVVQKQKAGEDPSSQYGLWAIANAKANSIPNYPGTEHVLAPIGESTPIERVQNLPAWAIQELTRSVTAHPQQQIATLVGGVGGSLLGGAITGGIGAIPSAIAVGGSMGAAFGGPEYAGDIASAAMELGAYPGAEKVGGRGLNPGAIEGAGYTSALLDAGSEVAAFAMPAMAPVRSFLAKAAIKIGQGAAIESSTEAMQKVLENAAIGEPLEKDVAQSAAAGVILGGVLGGAGSFMNEGEGPKKERPQPEPRPAVDAVPVEPGSPPSGGGMGFNDSVLLPEAPPKLSTSPEVETEEAPDDFNPQADIERASRYAEAQMHVEDVFSIDELTDPEEGVTRSIEPAEAYRTQRLSEEEGIEAARNDIQTIMQEEGVDFPTAMNIFKDRGEHERLGRLISPTVHSNPFREDDEIVPAVKVVERDSAGKVVRESVYTIPEGKTIQDYANKFEAAQKTDTIRAPKEPARKPSTPAPNDAGFYSRAQEVFDASPRQVGNGKKWAEVFTGAGVKQADLPHILPGLEKNKQYSRDDIAKMLEQRRGVEVNRLRYESLDDPESGASGFKDDTRYEDYSISKIVPGAKDYGETLVKLTGEGPGQSYTNLHFPGEEGLVGHVRHFKMPDGSFVVEENQSFLHQAQRNLEEANDIAVTEDDVNTAKETLIEARDAFELSVDQALNEIDTLKEMIEEASKEFEEGDITDFLDELEFKLEEAQSVSNVTRPQRGFETDQEYEAMQSSALEQAHEDGDNLIQLFNEGIESIFNEGDGVPQVLKDLEDQIYKVGRALEELSIDDVRSAELSVIEAEGALLDAQDSISDAKGAPLANDYTERMIQTALMQAVRDPEATGFYHVGPDVRNGNIEFGNDISKGMKLHYETIRDQELARIAKQFGLKTKDKKIKIDDNEYRNRLRNYKDQLKEAVNLELRKPVEQQNQKAIEEVGAELERVGKILNSDEDLINPEITVRGFDLTPEQKARIASKGFPLLKAGQRTKGAPLSIAERQWLYEYARRFLDDAGMQDIQISFPDLTPGNNLAEFDPLTQMVYIATTYLPLFDAPLDQTVRDLLNHEMVHAVLNIEGAIDEARWQSIKREVVTGKPTQKQLDKLNWTRKGVGPDKTWMQNLRIQFPEYADEAYQEIAKERAAASGRDWTEELHDIHVEEVIAEFSTLYGKRNDDIPAFARPIVARIFKLMRPIIKAARAFARRIGADRRSELMKFVQQVQDGEFPLDDLTNAKKAGIFARVNDQAPEGEYSDVPQVAPVPRGFFSAVEESWKTISARGDLPNELPLYKWIQRMQKVHKEFRPKKAELDYIFRGVPLDATLSKGTVDQIIALNKIELKRHYSTDLNGEDAIRGVSTRLPGATQEKYESVMALPEGVQGSQFKDSHSHRAPIWVKGAYVSTMGEVRPVIGADGKLYQNADFVGQIQSDLVQGLQEERSIEQIETEIEDNKRAFKDSPDSKIIQSTIERLEIEKELRLKPPPLNETERFVRIGLGDALTRAAANGRDVVAFAYGNTVDMVQRGGSRYLADIRQSVARLEAALAKAEATGKPDLIEDAKSDLKPVKETLGRLERRINFYSETVKNAAEKMARRIGAEVEIGRIPFEKKDNKLKMTPTGQKMVDALGFAESPRLQQIAKRIASIINKPSFNRADFVQAVQGYEMAATMLGDQRSAAKANLLSNDLTLNSVSERVGGSVDQGLAVIIKLNPEARTKIIRDSFPLFAARKGPAKPRHNPPGMRFGASVNPDPGTNEVLPHIGGYIEDVINVRQQQAAANTGPKMLNKPIAGGVIDFASQVGEKAMRNIWTALKIDGMFKWYTPFGKINDASTYEMLRMISQGRVAQIEAVAAKEFKILSKHEEMYEEILDYLMTAPGRDIEITNIDTGETTIHSEQRALERITDPKVQAAAVKAKKALNELGQMLVDHGFIDKGQYEKFKGSYLPGMYAKHIESYRTPTGIRMSGVPYRYSKKGPKVTREGTGSTDPNSTDLIVPGTEIDSGGVDYTITGLGPTDKALLGEIRDPGILVTHAIVRGMRDLAIANFLNAAVHHSASSPTNPKWVLPQTMVVYGGKPMSLWEFANEKDRIEQQLNEEKDRLWRLRENTSFQYEVLSAELKWMDDVLKKSRFKEIYLKGEFPDDYKMVPKDPTRYGDMAGAIVRKEIYHDLMNSFAVFNPEEGTIGQQIQATQRKLLNVFKMSKTVLSLGGQARQAYSNIMMVGLAGANPAVRVPQAVQQIIDHYMLGKTSPAMQAAIEGGQTAATLTKAELRMMDELQRKLSDAGKSGRFWNSSPTMAPALRVVKMLREVAAKTGNAFGAAYQLTDTIGKLAIIIDEMDRGQPPLIAAHKARKWFGDYSAVPPVIRSARESGLAPFITYFYITLPNMVETMATRPWAFWPYYATGILLAGAAGAMLNGDDDDNEVTWMGFNFDRDSMVKAMNPMANYKNTKEDKTQVPLEEAAKKTAPEYLAQDKFATVLPIRDSYGRPQMVTTKPQFAFSPIPEAANAAMKADVWKAMQSAGVNGGPTFAIGSVVATGIEPGLQRKIWDEKDPQEVRNAKTMMYMLHQFTPPEVASFAPPGNSIPLFSLFPGAEGVEAGRGYNAITGRGVNKKGDPTWDSNQMWLREAGITLTPLDISKARRDRMTYDYDRPITELKREIRAMQDRPDVDPKVRAENIADMQKRLDRLEEERKQFAFDTARIITVEVQNQRRLKAEQK